MTPIKVETAVDIVRIIGYIIAGLFVLLLITLCICYSQRKCCFRNCGRQAQNRPRQNRFEASFRLLPKSLEARKHEARKQFSVSKQPSTEADCFGRPKQFLLPKIFDHFVWSASGCFHSKLRENIILEE